MTGLLPSQLRVDDEDDHDDDDDFDEIARLRKHVFLCMGHRLLAHLSGQWDATTYAEFLLFTLCAGSDSILWS